MSQDTIAEKALVLAVVEQAVRDYLMHITTMLDKKNKTTLRNLQRSALQWIFYCDDEADIEEPFTFPWCCNELNISTKRMRTIIKALQENKDSPIIHSCNIYNIVERIQQDNDLQFHSEAIFYR